MLLLILVACSPDPKPIQVTRYFIEGVERNDDNRIEKGLCLNVQHDSQKMTVGPFIESYLNQTVPDFNIRDVEFKILTTETTEAVVEAKLDRSYYFLTTVEDRGWCVCGDLVDWQNTAQRTQAIQACRGR